MIHSCKKAATMLLATAAILAMPALVHAQDYIPEPDIIYYGQVPAGEVVQIERGTNQPAGTAVLGSSTAGADGYAIRVKLVSPATTPTPAPPDGVAYLTHPATVFVGNVAQGQLVLDERGAIYQLDFTNPARTPSPNAVLTPLRVAAAQPTPPSCGAATCTPSSTPTITATPTRTGTPTPPHTPTATSTSAIVTGAVTLEGHPPTPSTRWRVPLRVSLTRSGEPTPFVQYTPSTDDNGSFQVDGITPGAYEIRVKNPKTLQVMKTVTLVSGVNSVAFGTLRAGDANDDNVVNLLDFSILRTTFGLAVGQPGYDARADFNDNNAVDLLDFSLMRPNFSQLGARALRLVDTETSSASEAEESDAVSTAETGGPTATPTATKTPARAVVVVPTTAVGVGQSFEVTVQIEAGEQEIDGASAYLDYDSSVLEVVKVTPGTALPAQLQNRSDVPGKVDFAAGAFQDFPSGTFTLVTVEFRAVTDPAGTRLTLSRESQRETDAAFAGASVLTSVVGGTVGGDDSPLPGAIGDGSPGPTPVATGTASPTPNQEAASGGEEIAASSQPESTTSGGCQTSYPGTTNRTVLLLLLGGMALAVRRKPLAVVARMLRWMR